MKKILAKNKSKITLLAIIMIIVMFYFFNPNVNQYTNKIFKMFSSGDFKVVRDFINEYGTYAMLVSAGLMVLQSVVAPMPAFLITFANANLFGWWQGAILSWASAMLGAVICFYISRILGRGIVEKLTSKTGLEGVDRFFEKHGRNSILIARLLPFISFDLVSYGAGFTSMSFMAFFIATGIGQLPATVIYSYVGGMLTGGTQLLVTGLLILFALSIFIVLLKNIFSKKKNKGNKNHHEKI